MTFAETYSAVSDVRMMFPVFAYRAADIRLWYCRSDRNYLTTFTLFPPRRTMKIPLAAESSAIRTPSRV